MGWLKNIRIKKDEKAQYELTADIERIADNISIHTIVSDIKYEIVRILVIDLKNKLQEKYIDEMLKEITFEDLKKETLDGFRDSIKHKFLND